MEKGDNFLIFSEFLRFYIVGNVPQVSYVAYRHLVLDFSCRHWTIAKYFGDEKPECNKSCDCCAQPKMVEKALEDVQRCAYGSMKKGVPGGAMYTVTDDDVDMYGGGRRGAKR